MTETGGLEGGYLLLIPWSAIVDVHLEKAGGKRLIESEEVKRLRGQSHVEIVCVTMPSPVMQD